MFIRFCLARLTLAEAREMRELSSHLYRRCPIFRTVLVEYLDDHADRLRAGYPPDDCLLELPELSDAEMTTLWEATVVGVLAYRTDPMRQMLYALADVLEKWSPLNPR